MTRFHHLLAGCVAAAALLAAGCGGAPQAEFRTNLAYVEVQRRATGEVTDATVQNIADLVTGLFGTPDEPHLPALGEVDARELLDIDKLQMAAGKVSREESGRPHGLYREHCAHCHGVTGDGMGPTAKWLNPYPRDYRRGLFKFKSTPLKTPPAHEDLVKILYDGIPGTAMPSFKLLAEDELAALVEYVKYLSLRGQVERSLIAYAADQFDADGMFVSTTGDDDRGSVARRVKTEIRKWAEADSKRFAIPQRPPMDAEQLAASIANGRKLFHGKLAQCSKCHGETALGDGVQNDYDDWTKELEPTKPEVFQQFVDQELAFPARNAIPRNLRLNVFRGGRRPVDIYRRIKLGITGAPMPAAATIKDTVNMLDGNVKEGEIISSGPDLLTLQTSAGRLVTIRRSDIESIKLGDPSSGLSHKQIWDIVNYVRNLPYENASEPPQKQPAYQRDRL